MNSIIEDPSAPMPGSPPELSGSKSSKTSSFHSSYQSDNDEILTDIAHFEDIGLDDDARSDHVFVSQDPVVLKPYSATYITDLRTSAKRPQPSHAPRTTTMQRELTSSAMRPSYPSLRGPVRGALGETGLGLMPGTTSKSRGGLSSPSAPSLTMLRRNRSSSPNHFNIPPSPATKHRRLSWQSNRERKTLQELEKECDEEDGDDVPDDCLLENVPISPRPFKDRVQSAPPSPDRVEKKEKVRSVGNGTPAIPVAQGSLRSPASSKPPLVQRGISMGQFPISHDGFGRPPRAKSWTAALSDLSVEAQALTEALEAHSDEQKSLPKERRSMSAAQPKLRHKSSLAELPPLRRTDIMIDPLPISKEKEAVLSRTRPSWLPPKNPAEEKRHLKEYQRMMALSLEAERKKEAEQKARVTCRDDTASSLLRIWEEHVLPNWTAVVGMKRTRELWWRGVSPRSRGVVWQRAVGNELGLTPTSFDAALRRAKDLERKLATGQGTEEERRLGLAFEAIRKDVATTYPELRIFQLGGPLCDGLVDVLMAYTMYRSDVGYVTGTNVSHPIRILRRPFRIRMAVRIALSYLHCAPLTALQTMAALLLLNLPTTSATFITLSNLLNRPLPLSFMTKDRESTARIYSLAIETIASKLPTLYNHLCSMTSPTINFRESPAVYLKPLFADLFTSSLDLDNVTRLWDVWVFEGDAVLVRAAVGLFSLAETKLYSATSRDEVLRVFAGLQAEMGTGASKIGEEQWMKAVREAGRAEKATPIPS